MAKGDFPFNRLELNLQPIVAFLRARAEVGERAQGQETRQTD
jgi:hypothetical protein